MLFILRDIKEMPKAMHTSRYIKEDVNYTHKHDQCIFRLEKNLILTSNNVKFTSENGN